MYKNTLITDIAHFIPYRDPVKGKGMREQRGGFGEYKKKSCRSLRFGNLKM